MTEPHDISAVFFDMDGTLIDSELNTEPAIATVFAELGISDVTLDYPAFYGRTWSSVVDTLVESYPQLSGMEGLAERFHRQFHDLCQDNPPPPIPGAREAIIELSNQVPVAIVSSAYRESIEATIAQLAIEEFVSCYVGAEDFAASKPAPDCFLHAAGLLEVNPRSCLVFEDSTAGLAAARAAGMWAIAIMHRSNNADRANELGHMAIDDYTVLDSGYASRFRGPG